MPRSPAWWRTCSVIPSFRSCATANGTTALRRDAPRLPPTTRRRSAPSRRANLTAGGSWVAISARTGLPTTSSSTPGGNALGNALSTRRANFASTRFEYPAMAFCSWISSGRRVSHAATPPGPVTNPPKPTTRLGLRRRITPSACQMDCSSLKGASTMVSAPLPRSPLMARYSMTRFSAGTTRASRPLRVPSQTTSCEDARNRRASANAGKT